MNDVVIVGAGTSGLALAYELKQSAIEPVILDEGPRVGETWRRRHDQLRLNTSRDLSHLPGLPMPKAYDVLPTRDQFVAYLEAYERFLDLPIRWETSVSRVAREDGGWAVETGAGPIRARHVAVATGPARAPVMPTWPGMDGFSGRIIHAGDFGRASDYAGKRVLIIGSGDSAIDIANCLTRVAFDACWIAVRTGNWITPLYQPNGRPSHEMLVRVHRLPARLLDAAVAWTSLRNFGRLDAYGFPAPKVGPITRLKREGASIPTDNGFVAALKAGRIEAVPEVAAFDGGAVRLKDGRHIAPDIVICATGYTPGVEGLVGSLGVLDAAGNPLVDADEPVPGQPGLWLFGLRNALIGNMNARRRHARRAARQIARALGRG